MAEPISQATIWNTAAGCLTAAIDKYIYVVVKQRFDDEIYVNYSKKEIVSRVEDLEHELVREAMLMTGVRGGVEITTLADIPSSGSGLGSSSSVTVGLLHALFAYRGRQVSAEELAERACAIEIERCGKPIGKQDQYIAALGGIRDLRFGPGDTVVADAGRALTRRPRWNSSSRSCCSIRASPGARTRSSRSRTRMYHGVACRTRTYYVTWPGSRSNGLRSGDIDGDRAS